MAFADFLGSHYHLRTVKISWNKIKTKGGLAIAEALKDNQRVAFFDGSFNMFGSKRDGKFGLKMGEACNNSYLRHVDLSYNSMDQKECEIFGQTIHDNHTLWGLHMSGNDCIIDSMQFVRAGLKFTKQSKDILHSPVSSSGLDFLNKLSHARNTKIMSY